MTGASRGIGRAVATAFAAQGDRVAIHYRDSPELAESLIGELPGAGHAVVQADLADPDEVRRMVDEAADALDGLDVLVNNAGVFPPHPVTDRPTRSGRTAWRRRSAST